MCETETFGRLTSKTIKSIRISFRDSLCHYAMAFFFFVFLKSQVSLRGKLLCCAKIKYRGCFGFEHLG